MPVCSRLCAINYGIKRKLMKAEFPLFATVILRPRPLNGEKLRYDEYCCSPYCADANTLWTRIRRESCISPLFQTKIVSEKTRLLNEGKFHYDSRTSFIPAAYYRGSKIITDTIENWITIAWMCEHSEITYETGKDTKSDRVYGRLL